MSYYSNFKISIVGDSELSTKTLLEIFNSQIAEEFIFSDEEPGKIKTQEDIQFREWQLFMRTLSLHYSRTLFLIEGHGEEKGDIWRAFVSKGEIFYQKAIITYLNIPKELMQQLQQERN